MTEDAAIIEEFKRLTREALTYDGSRGILAGIVDELVGILENAADFQADRQLDVTEGETASSEGLAISPTQAAMCAGEFQRTAIFLRGLHDAIVEAVELKSPETVHVLYAGSGPYATLAVPLMALFPPEKVRFTVLDMHAVSIASAKSVVSRLGLDRSVKSYVLADACDYAIPTDAIPDILLCETMSTALEREPQVAIMRHLLGQAPDAVIVPESVRVDAFLVDTSKEPDLIVPESEDPSAKWTPDRIPVGPVFELNAETIRSWASLSDDRLPAAVIRLPPPPEPSYRPFLFTAITTHGEHALRTHDCSLTGIREITDIDNLSAGRTVQFHYRLGAAPCLVAEAVDQRDAAGSC
ncbi:MAG: hypothetical protein CMN05_14950 [Roseibacillus sp.]|jgi:hypothetical protein|nr:hypothetical protein [Roseibacillus sp.]MBP36687.1 hypothetical protein [Roseibacillus sp.]MCP4730105.1 hypothetical protein [Roseibacillus sp.]MDP7107030.1 hypothetical protein [Roseibacillus sp.]MDP7654868.1 hypothetical protein [Roseibacillus sp.]|tara:strand:+ start:928 stop:1989 length:1062 start_codon:yes stop_codon:yes gene_type:complete